MITKCYDYEEIDYMGFDGIHDVRGGDGTEDVCRCQCGGSCAYQEALIHTNNNHWARTDYRGYWSMKYQFDSATVSKSGFLKTTVYLKELPDTVFLIPESTQLGTVEVWGKDQQHVKDMEDQVQQAASMIGSGTTGIGIDLGNMLDSRGRRDQKHLRNARKILGEYDKKDPIVSAYEQATGKQIQLSPPGMKKEEESVPELEENDGKSLK